MTKQEFFALRDSQRQAGEIIYTPEVYQNDLLEDEERIALEALGKQDRGVYRTADLKLNGLLCVETYVGKKVKVQRRKIDELDNVTIWKI
jgi:hypothetical protein